MKKVMRFFKDTIKNVRLYRYYNIWDKRAENREQWCIFMVDGRMSHGGLSDRLCGLVSTYCYCKEHNKIFKLYFQYPFQLEFFLLSNRCNWEISKDEISHNILDSSPIYISNRQDNMLQRKIANHKLNKQSKQLHIYTNMRYFRGNFSSLFHELFKPSPLLFDEVQKNLSQIDSDFISITFRFQQLLGDFKEGNFPILPQDKRLKLMSSCLTEIEKLHKCHSDLKVVVTSDSQSFLLEAKKFNYVYIIPGNIVHMDFTDEDNIAIHLKSFVDLFVISKAQKVYLVYSDQLYRSAFAKTAALLSGALYEEIKI